MIDGTFVVFSPFGDEVSLEGSWQIDAGEGPVAADAGSCDRAGVAQVRLDISESQGDGQVLGPDFVTFPCAQGSFDTRPDAVLDAGEYRARLTALDGEGEVAGRSSKLDLDATTGDHAMLPRVTLP
jgi:hypothetical protein